MKTEPTPHQRTHAWAESLQKALAPGECFVLVVWNETTGDANVARNLPAAPATHALRQVMRALDGDPPTTTPHHHRISLTPK